MRWMGSVWAVPASINRARRALTLGGPAFYIPPSASARAPMAELVDASELKIGFRKECWFDSG